MSYKLFITSKLISLQSQQITPQLALKALLEFDKAINNALATKVKNRITFKVGFKCLKKLVCIYGQDLNLRRLEPAACKKCLANNAKRGKGIEHVTKQGHNFVRAGEVVSLLSLL